MEISLVHPSMNKAGGAERYLTETIHCLRETGHSITLYTIDKTDWTTLSQTHGLNAEPDAEHYLQEKPLTPDGVFSWIRTAVAYTWLLIQACEKSDICINNYGEILPYFAQVSIVHSVPLGESNNYGIPLWGLIKPLYGITSGWLTPYRSEIIVTNSCFNATRIQHKGRIEIIYPPVRLPANSQAEKNGEILTVARLKQGKNLNVVAEIAAYSRNRFNVAGHSEYGSERLIRELRAFRNIEVYVNPPRDKIIELMNKCSLYLATQPDEAFGMAVVEAMSIGCVPLVYRGGGPWTDILAESETCGLTYDSAVEAVEKIREVLMDEEQRRALRETGAIRAGDFSTMMFRRHFIDFMNTVKPREKQETRIYRWYRRLTELREKVVKRASILVPL